MSMIVKLGLDSREYDKEMRKLQKSSNKISKSMNSLGNTLTASVTAPILGVAAASYKLDKDFRLSMANVQAISGVTGDELKTLEKKARELGATTSKSAKDGADALGYMALAGWNTNEMLDGLQPILELSIAGNMELARTSDLVTDSMAALRLTTGELPVYLDKVAKTSSVTNTNIDQLMSAFIKVGATSTNLSMSIEETAAALGVLANNGLKGDLAGTKLNSILMRMTAQTTPAIKAWAQLGVQTYDAQGKFRGFTTVLNEARQSLSKMNTEQQQMVLKNAVGIMNVVAFKNLLDATDGTMQDYTKTIADSNGKLADMRSIMENTAQGALWELESALEECGLVFAEHITPVITDAVVWITELANKFGSLDRETQRTIVKFLALAAAVGPMLKIASVGVKVVSTIKNMGNAMGAAYKKTMTNKAANDALARSQTKVSTTAATAAKQVNKLTIANERNAKVSMARATGSAKLGKMPKTSTPKIVKPENIKFATISKAEITGVNEATKAAKNLSKATNDVNKAFATFSPNDVKKMSEASKTVASFGTAGELATKGISPFTRAAKGIGSIFGNVGTGAQLASAGMGPLLLALGVGTGLFALIAKESKKSKEEVGIFSENAKKGFEGMDEATKKNLQPVIDSLKTINSETGKFEVPKVTQDPKEAEKEMENLKKSVNDGYDRILADYKKALDANKGLSTQERERRLKAKEAELKREREEINKHFEILKKDQQTFDTTMGMQKWEAGLDITKQELEILKMQEINAAHTESEKQKIREKYRTLEAERYDQYAKQMQDVMTEDFKTQLQSIDERYAEERKKIDSEHAANVQAIIDNYEVGTEEYKRLMDEENAAYAKRCSDIDSARTKEKESVQDVMQKYINMTEEMVKDGRITRETADKIIRAMRDIDEKDVDIHITDNLDEIIGKLQSAIRSYNNLRDAANKATKAAQDANKYGSDYKQGTGSSPNKYSNKVNANGFNSPAYGGMHAAGGHILGSEISVVGEAGPELLMKSGSSVRVQPLSSQEKRGGFSDVLGNSGPSIVVQQLVVREEADIRKIANELKTLEDRQKRFKGK